MTHCTINSGQLFCMFGFAILQESNPNTLGQDFGDNSNIGGVGGDGGDGDGGGAAVLCNLLTF